MKIACKYRIELPSVGDSGTTSFIDYECQIDLIDPLWLDKRHCIVKVGNEDSGIHFLLYTFYQDILPIDGSVELMPNEKDVFYTVKRINKIVEQIIENAEVEAWTL